jgi:IclR family pca regulon transcriptional regulator
MPRVDSRPARSRENHPFVPAPPNSLDVAASHLAQIDALNGDPNFMTSLARGLAVIQAFSSRRRRLTISQISLRTGFSRAAVRRCLYTLVKLCFAGTEDAHYFYLRPRILSLGYAFINSMPLLAAAQPTLEQMSHHSLESCWIGMLEGTEVICVAHANATRVVAVDVRVGSRVPSFCTAAGQVLLANLPEEEQESFIARIKFTRYTKQTVTSATRLRHVLRLVQRNGYAVVDQELEIGVWALAVPIHHQSGRVVAALCIAALSHRVSAEKSVMKFLSRMQDGAQELSMLLN